LLRHEITLKQREVVRIIKKPKKEARTMKRFSIFIAAIGLLGFILSTESSAQGGFRWRGSGGWGPGSQYSRMYDPKTVGTVSGEVVSVDKIIPIEGMSYGVHLTLMTDKETISVQLGPGWYIENQDVKIEPKDMIEVKGSRITYEGKPAIIAAEVKKGDEVLKLRDENGFPIWAGWRRP
jgi:hypothetical protein